MHIDVIGYRIQLLTLSLANQVEPNIQGQLLASARIDKWSLQMEIATNANLVNLVCIKAKQNGLIVFLDYP